MVAYDLSCHFFLLIFPFFFRCSLTCSIAASGPKSVLVSASTAPLASESGTLWQDRLGTVDALHLPRLCYLLYLFPTQLLHLNPTVKSHLDLVKMKTSCSSFHMTLLLEWLQIPAPPGGVLHSLTERTWGAEAVWPVCCYLPAPSQWKKTAFLTLSSPISRFLFPVLGISRSRKASWLLRRNQVCLFSGFWVQRRYQRKL